MNGRVAQVANAAPRRILTGRLHRILSGRYALLDFTGRMSGRRYVLPVAYVHAPDPHTLWVSTDSRWWVNIGHGEPFEIVLRGTRHRAAARLLDTVDAVPALASLATVPGFARAAGLRREDGAVPADELTRAAGERVVLAIRLGERV